MKNNYNILLKNYLGKISGKEKEILEHWLKSGDKKKSISEDIEKIWELTGNTKQEINVDVNEEWGKFLKLRNDNNEKIRIISGQSYRKNLNYIIRIAAVLIFGIFVYSIFQNIIDNQSNADYIVKRTELLSGKIELDDGSVVWLNKNSNLSYPGTFNNKRIVYLSGEAYFDVKKSKKPFIINTENSVTKVLGTSFNVRAYKQDNVVEVTVVEGKVQFQSNSGKEKIIITKGERGSINLTDFSINKETNKDLNFLAWKDKKLIFQNDRYDDINSILENYYNIKIHIENDISNCTFTGIFDDPGLEEFLNIFTISLELQYVISGDTVYLKGQGCE